MPGAFCAVPEWQTVHDFVSPGDPVRIDGAPVLLAVSPSSESIAVPNMNPQSPASTSEKRKVFVIGNVI